MEGGGGVPWKVGVGVPWKVRWSTLEGGIELTCAWESPSVSESPCEPDRSPCGLSSSESSRTFETEHSVCDPWLEWHATVIRVPASVIRVPWNGGGKEYLGMELFKHMVGKKKRDSVRVG